MKTVLVASGTANTGSNVVRALSASGKASVKALTRKPESAAAQSLAGLPNVSVVKGDFMDEPSLKSALAGVDRAFLVGQPGEDTQHDMEVAFLKAAMDAGIQGTVRISTCNSLIDVNSTGVYGKAHAKTEVWVKEHGAKCCDLRPNWYMSNMMWQAAEIKPAGTYSVPCPNPPKRKMSMVDPRDIGASAAAILTSDDATFAKFIEAGYQAVCGPQLTDFAEQCAALSDAIGKTVTVKQVTADEFTALYTGAGLTPYFAQSFTQTALICSGEAKEYREHMEETSPLLLSIYKPQHDVVAWAKENAAAFM